MFTPNERAALRASLIERATSDRRISGVAITGSAALEREDRWSDIDLAFGVLEASSVRDVMADWTGTLYRDCGAIHHVDIVRSSWTYRVFLLSNTLQVDLGFVAASEFRAAAPSFKLVSGAAREPRYAASPVSAELPAVGPHVRESGGRC